MAQLFLWITGILLLFLRSVWCYNVDPSDFFLGAQHRPKLEILSPENGEVLDDNDVRITVKISGYDIPSSFHDSKVCIALSTGATMAEGCFDQTADLVFHAKGLTAGQQYSLQVSFYERGKAIAVSVRNFRVAGIRGLLEGDEPVTIMTAVQLAIQFQTRSMMEKAESIYRSILSEYPAHPNALHMMGIIYYQKGDPLSAIPFIQQAMLGNKTSESFHNSLGECYRDLGRLDEAIAQYEAALSMNPNMISALFNLGRALQEQRRWKEAIETYQRVQALVTVDLDLLRENNPVQGMREDSMIRECDLLQGSRLLQMAAECWQRGLAQYPDNQYAYNELGNLLGQNGQYEEAYELYRVAISKGSVVAELNAAHMLEQLGYYAEAQAAYDEAMQAAQSRGMPQFHIQVRRAMILPRILPSQAWLVEELRANLEVSLDNLLRADHSSSSVDNAPPLYFGYSLGYYLAFHTAGQPVSNLVLKTKLYRVYSRMCPALLQGYFFDRTSDQSGNNSTLQLGQPETEPTTSVVPSQEPSADASLASANRSMPDAESHEVPKDSTSSITTTTTTLLTSGTTQSGAGTLINLRLKAAQQQSSQQSQRIGSDSDSSIDTTKTVVSSTDNDTSGSQKPLTHRSNDFSRHIDAVHNLPRLRDRVTNVPLIRVGFVSRYMQIDHPAGVLVQGIVPLLGVAGYEVIVFHIDSVTNASDSRWDAVKETIRQKAHAVVYLPLNLGDCASVIRAANLDVLVYPEIGMDPLSYFLAYSRLAPVQAVWLAHPDTTGVSTVDYFLGSEVEEPEAQINYSEKLIRLSNLGTVFADTFSFVGMSAHEHSSPRTALLDRARFVEELHLPRGAHLYVIAQPLDRLHPDFDVVLAKLLTQDRLGYLMFVDPSSASVRRSWRSLFVSRVAGAFSTEVRERMLFMRPSNYSDTLRAISAAHVLLDPFPMSGLLSCLQALALGVPVLTFPFSRLGGRFALALYRQMHMLPGKRSHVFDQVGEDANLVVASVNEYISTALALTHKPRLREAVVRDITSRRHMLFTDTEQRKQVVSDWRNFIGTALSAVRNDKI